MVERFFRSREIRAEAKATNDKVESKATKGEESARGISDDYRASVKQTIENEVAALIQEEIKTAARELVEEQRKAIRQAVEQHKQIIRDVLDEEKAAFREQAEELRRSVMSLGRG